MKRFILLYALFTAFQIGQLSKTDLGRVVGADAAFAFGAYFWITLSLLLSGLTFMLWRALSRDS